MIKALWGWVKGSYNIAHTYRHPLNSQIFRWSEKHMLCIYAEHIDLKHIKLIKSEDGMATHSSVFAWRIPMDPGVS